MMVWMVVSGFQRSEAPDGDNHRYQGAAETGLYPAGFAAESMYSTVSSCSITVL
jgi:hypothetical protein